MCDRRGTGRRGCTRGAAQSSILVAALAVLVLAAGCAEVAPRPAPPRVALDGVRVTRVAAGEARFRVRLIVSNPNPYDLAVSSIDARLAVEGEALLTGALAAPVVLASGADTPVEIEARTGLAAMAGVLDRLTRQRTLRYEVTGAAIVQNGWRLPFSRTGELPVGDMLGLPR